MSGGELTQPPFSWGSYDYEGVPTNGDHLSPDATLYGCPFFESSGYYQEGLLQAIIHSPHKEEEPSFATSPWNDNLEAREAYDELQPNNGCGNWLSDCNSMFNGCWEIKYGSLGNGRNNNSENIESSNTVEEQCDNSLMRRDDEDAENYPAMCDYDPWSSCDSWLKYGQEHVSSADGGDETDVLYERILRDAEVYEGIFGYWPCLNYRQ